MKTFEKFCWLLAGMVLTLIVFVPYAGTRESKYHQIIELQDSLIHKAQDELEYHTGDYSFCDGDEPIVIEELKKSL